MEENLNNGLGTGNDNSKKDCGCEGGDCCQPKKSNKMTKVLFGVILLAALSIIVIKLVNPPDTAVAKAKSGCCADPKASGCDTSKQSGCDTSKGSSCCSKK